MTLATILCAMGCSSPEQSRPEYYNQIVKELSSDSYFGRNDYNNGDVKAAKFIIDELIKMGVEPLAPQQDAPQPQTVYPYIKSVCTPCGPGRWEGEDEKYLAYLQSFSYPLNVMRGAAEFTVDGVTLEPTVDYVFKEFSPSCKGEFDVYYLPDEYYTIDGFCKYLSSGAFKNSFVVVDFNKYLDKMCYSDWKMEIYKEYLVPLENVGGVILQNDSPFPFFKSRSHYLTKMPVVMAYHNFPKDAKKVTVNLESQMIEQHDAHNVIAYIEGKSNPDSCIIFSAHYDHLGVMGEGRIFNGANDDASGVAMVLTLAQYYKKHRPSCSIMFIFFDGEESNLLGSFYYNGNPRLPIERVKYMIEPDMIGDTGDTLICQISDEGKAGLELMEKINNSAKEPFGKIDCQLLTDLSDHYPFALQHVPAAYFSIEGENYQYYHTPRDTYEHTSDENYERLFQLFVAFVKKY